MIGDSAWSVAMLERRVRWVRAGARAPRLVIDERGGEVAVVVDYGQYVGLLRMVAAELGPRRLSPYWRSALEDCLALRRRERGDSGGGSAEVSRTGGP